MGLVFLLYDYLWQISKDSKPNAVFKIDFLLSIRVNLSLPIVYKPNKKS